jgi:hypothetical protein
MPTQYSNVVACDARTEEALERYLDIDYPIVVAQCLQMDAGAAALWSSDVKLPPPKAPAPAKRRISKPGETARG